MPGPFDLHEGFDETSNLATGYVNYSPGSKTGQKMSIEGYKARIKYQYQQKQKQIDERHQLAMKQVDDAYAKGLIDYRAKRDAQLESNKLMAQTKQQLEMMHAKQSAELDDILTNGPAHMWADFSGKIDSGYFETSNPEAMKSYQQVRGQMFELRKQLVNKEIDDEHFNYGMKTLIDRGNSLMIDFKPTAQTTELPGGFVVPKGADDKTRNALIDAQLKRDKEANSVAMNSQRNMLNSLNSQSKAYHDLIKIKSKLLDSDKTNDADKIAIKAEIADANDKIDALNTQIGNILQGGQAQQGEPQPQAPVPQPQAQAAQQPRQRQYIPGKIYQSPSGKRFRGTQDGKLEPIQ